VNTELEASQTSPVCVWICGMAGTGKTTLANALVTELRQAGIKVAQLDGDVIRDLLGERSPQSFTKEARERLSSLYGRLCLALVQGGFSVVIATVSMSAKVSTRNRGEIPGYFEVVLAASRETLAAIDKEEFYSTQAFVVGRDVAMEEPVTPDLRFETDDWLFGRGKAAFDSAVKTIVRRTGLL
jgi:adenylylsulfate kinase-like enzyme